MKSKILLTFIYFSGAIAIATICNAVVLLIRNHTNPVYIGLLCYSILYFSVISVLLLKSRYNYYLKDTRAKNLVCIVNQNGIVLSANNYFRFLSEKYVQNMYIGDVFKIIDSDQHFDFVEQIRKKNQANKQIKLIICSKKAILNVIFSVQLIGQKNAENIYRLTFEPILIHQNLEQEADEFIDLASHEIRTPLATLEGLVDNLITLSKSDKLSKSTIEQQLTTAYGEIEKLSSLINDLDFLSDARKQTKIMQYSSFSPQLMLDEMKYKYGRLAQTKGLKLITEKISCKNLISIEPYVYKIIEIFVDNAIKYTPSGQVVIKSLPYKNGVLISVEDTGVGIAKAEQTKIFDKFYQGDDPYTRSKNGLGLSLYLANTLASKLGAEITVESRVGKGSKFNLYIKNKIIDKASTDRVIQAEIDDAMASL